MRRWAFMLGGLIVWTVHFFGVYALASLGEAPAAAGAAHWRLLIAGFSGVSLALALALAVHAAVRRRRAGQEKEARFAPDLAMVGAGLAAVAILWQSLPAWFGG